MMRSKAKSLGVVLLAGLLYVPAWGDATTAQPGTLNYVEGRASLDGKLVSTTSIGSADLQAGQILATQDRKTEILLTPGVFLRTGPNSSVRMDSPGLADTSLTLVKGRAMVEVAEIHHDNNIVVRLGGADVRLTSRGLYDFDADRNQIRVFDGEVAAVIGGKTYHVHGGHELTLNDQKLKARGFDKKTFEDGFYRWSSLRSSYLAEANVDAARSYYSGGSGWYGNGWYWDPWFSAYTWIPGNGFLYSPFGWGYYSPFAVYSAPVFFGYGGFGYHHFGPAYRPRVGAFQGTGVSRGFVTGPRAGGVGGVRSVGGFRGAGAGAHVGGGAGIHMGGGGMHGGGRR